MKKSLRLLQFMIGLFVLLTISACGGGGGGGGGSALEGTWHLSTVNGQPINRGVFLTYVFTATTLTITDDLDCGEEIGSYTIDGNMLTVITTKSSECGPDVGNEVTAEFEVSNNTLTIKIISERSGLGIFVFTRARN